MTIHLRTACCLRCRHTSLVRVRSGSGPKSIHYKRPRTLARRRPVPPLPAYQAPPLLTVSVQGTALEYSRCLLVRGVVTGLCCSAVRPHAPIEIQYIHMCNGCDSHTVLMRQEVQECNCWVTTGSGALCSVQTHVPLKLHKYDMQSVGSVPALRVCVRKRKTL